MIYICIPVFERLNLTKNCINSIKRSTYSDYTIVICEHSSDKKNYYKLKELYPDIILLRGNEYMWWTQAMNECVDYVINNCAEDDYIYTLNNDTEIDENCLLKSLELAKVNYNSIIGSVNLLYDSRERIEISSFLKIKIFGLTFYKRLHRWADFIKPEDTFQIVNAMSGKGLLIPVKVFKEIGTFNSSDLPHYHADTEFTIRCEKNDYQLILNYASKVYSHYDETGMNARNNISLNEFIKGLYDIKSTRHLISLKNKARLVYGKTYLVYYNINLILITAGFIRRKIVKFFSKR